MNLLRSGHQPTQPDDDLGPPKSTTQLTVCELWIGEPFTCVTDYLQCLDDGSSRQRFAHRVSDDFIANYAERMFKFGAIAYGCFPQNRSIRSVGKSRKTTES